MTQCVTDVNKGFLSKSVLNKYIQIKVGFFKNALFFLVSDVIPSCKSDEKKYSQQIQTFPMSERK